MKYAYLVASLPTLSLDTMPPIQYETFLRWCDGVLDEQDQRELQHLLKGDAAACVSPFAASWFGFETTFRRHIARVRAGRLGLNPKAVVPEADEGDSRIRQGVLDAFAKSNPREREWTIDNVRWTVLEELRRTEPYGLTEVLAFAVQLQLAHRWSRFSAKKGSKALVGHEAGLIPAAYAEAQ